VALFYIVNIIKITSIFTLIKTQTFLNVGNLSIFL